MEFNFFAIPLLIIKATWWIITPIILFKALKNSYLYFIALRYINNVPWTLLEIRLPQEVLKTPKAMEYVIAGLHGAWDSLDWRDIWIKGEVLASFSLEIVGTEGEVHFYVYTQTKLKEFTKQNIYAQYPDAEVLEVEDYTQKLPPIVPNKKWDLWGTDLRLVKENPYPIRRYMDFEEVEEEKRLDPISQIAEVMNALGPGEHMWIQILIQPSTEMEQLKKEGDEIVGKLLKREPKEAPRGALAGIFQALINFISGALGFPVTPKEDERPQTLTYAELMLSPGERDALKAIEEKTAKLAYETLIRFIYVGRTEVFNKANIPALFGFFRHFNTFNLNGFAPNRNTYPRRSFVWFRNTRTYMRKLRLYMWYKYRNPLPGNISNAYIMNTEELASMFHFPGQTVKAPAMPRVPGAKPPPP